MPRAGFRSKDSLRANQRAPTGIACARAPSSLMLPLSWFADAETDQGDKTCFY